MSDTTPGASQPPRLVPRREQPGSARIDGLPAEWTSEMRRNMARIMTAGCLAMVYLELTGSSAQVQYARSLGAEEFHFGVIGAIPPAMLLVQFASALLINRLRYRKSVWIKIMIAQRALAVPLALVPWLLPNAGPAVWVWCMLGLLAVTEALGNLGVPMWYSWMGDLLPLGHLSEFWARRRRWLSLASAASLVFSAAFFQVLKDVDIRITYLIVGTLGAIAGVSDILLFLKLPEPKVESHPGTNLRLLSEPFKDRRFRRYIFFSSFWAFAATFSFPFFRLYMLKVLGLELPQIMLLFLCHALGGTLFAEHFGRLTDRVGQRPVMVLCTMLKSLIVIAYFLARPGASTLLMVPVMLFDNMINTGFFVAQNGFILRHSPKQNRSMFVAAVLATGGLAGAASSLLAGTLLHYWEGFAWDGLGIAWTNFHLVFAIGIVLRWLSILGALSIHEPESAAAGEVLTQTVAPAVLRWVNQPVGFFGTTKRNALPHHGDAEDTEKDKGSTV